MSTSPATVVSVIEPEREPREWLGIVIGRSPGCQLLSSHASLREARIAFRARGLEPKVILLSQSNCGCAEAIRATIEAVPKARIIARCTADEETILNLVEAGAVGHVREDASPAQIIAAIQQTGGQGSFLSSKIVYGLARRVQEMTKTKFALPDLTGRENEILNLLAEGVDTKQLTVTLAISKIGLASHFRNIYRKLGVHSRSQAIVKYLAATQKRKELGG